VVATAAARAPAAALELARFTVGLERRGVDRVGAVTRLARRQGGARILGDGELLALGVDRGDLRVAPLDPPAHRREVRRPRRSRSHPVPCGLGGLGAVRFGGGPEPVLEAGEYLAQLLRAQRVPQGTVLGMAGEDEDGLVEAVLTLKQIALEALAAM
jgi:hypothetical protein